MTNTPKSDLIQVAVVVPVHRIFTYRVTVDLQERAAVGKRILVPFGARRATGYILALGPADEPGPLEKIKPVEKIPDERPLFGPSMVPFLRWIADYYHCPIGEVVRNALPGGLNWHETVVLVLTAAGADALADRALKADERDVLVSLQGRGRSLQQVAAKASPGLIRSLEQNGWLVRERQLKAGRTRPQFERMVVLAAPLSEALTQVTSRAKTQQKILQILDKTENPPLALRQLQKQVPSAGPALRALEKRQLVTCREVPVYRDPFGQPITPSRPLTLTKPQQQVFDRVHDAMGQGFAAFLLAGVTGSGKTEVYLQLAAVAIAGDLRVLVLVPEIALISQMERRFRARFGDQVALLHSGLSDGERYDQWLRITSGEAVIAIGARSAIFAPFAKTGLIIVDEEHDTSYKQESQLRYNARDLAVVRAKLDNGLVLLGSATPSVQSYYNTKIDKFNLIRMTERVMQRPLPDIQVVDLTAMQAMRGMQRFITPDLRAQMQATLGRGEQVLLFLNRRGYAHFPVCAACGEALKCRRCDITLTLHQKANALRCHFCGYSQAAVTTCRLCGSSNIKMLGLGTEKVEAAVRKLFPDARVARMDRDTTTGKNDIVKLLKGVREQTIDILIGTQMVAKGHDFPFITLVGIVCADLALGLPDFRAGERTFQLLAQVAGRAGRGENPGRVVLQTYNPQHFAIRSAQAQDFERFFEKEIQFRQTLGFPPFTRLAQLRISGTDKARTMQLAQSLGEKCRQIAAGDGRLSGVTVMGPIEAPLAKLANRYRWHMMLKSGRADDLHQFLNCLQQDHHKVFTQKKISVVIDVDPMGML